MATWKKVIVSGSDISLLNNDSNYLTSAGSIDSASHVADAFKSVSVSDATLTLTQFDGDTSDVTVNNVVAANTASVLATARSFTTTGDVVLASVNFDGSENFTTTATIQANAVENSMMADDSVNSAEIVDGAIDPIHFATATKTAVSGAFTSDSASIASDIAALVAGTYTLEVSASDGTNGVILDTEAFSVLGGTNLGSTMSGNNLTLNLDGDINLTSVTASIQGDVAGNLTGNVTGNVNGDLTGNVTGDVTGTADTASYIQPSAIDGIIDISDQTNFAVSDTTGQTGINMTLSGDTLSAVVSGLETGDSPTFANLTLTGDLTVQGTRTELNVTNLNVEDQFILINSGASAADGGLVVNGAGSALGWDNSAGRFALDYAGATFDQTSITSDAFISSVVTTDDANYRKVGNIRIDTSNEDIYIYS